MKTTFQDLINALRPISPVQFLPHLPSSPASSHTGTLSLAKWHMKKVKTERLNVKMGHSSRCIPNAHLTFEYSLKAFFTQLFTAKSKYTKKETSKAFIENPGMQCLRCVVEREHRKPFLQFFFCLFPTVLYCNCVKLKYAPCCVVSSLCPNDLICEKTTGPDAKSERSVDLSLVRFFRVKSVSVLGVDRFPPPALPGSPPTHPSSCTAYVSVHEKQQQVLLVN